MRYVPDPLLEKELTIIVSRLFLSHIPLGRLKCVRSCGSKSRRTLARIHTIPQAVQKGLNLQPHYVIEVISENFDKLTPEEKTKTLIHELLHIPHSFSGGFRPHRPHVTRRTVEKVYREYRKADAGGLFSFWRTR